MKKIFLLLILMIIISSCKKDDYFKQGVILKVSREFYGLLPCPDCRGIYYELRLKDDMTYKELMVYRGKSDKPVISEGKWELEGSDRLKLYKQTDAMSNFEISKKNLIMLDENGKRFVGPEAAKYILSFDYVEIPEDTAKDSVKTVTATDTVSTSVNGKWRLIEINGQKPDEGHYMTGIPDLEIREADKKFTSNSGCNRTNGGVQIVGNQMSFSKFFSTKNTCPGTGESEYVNTLRSVDSYKIEKGILILNAAGKTVLKFNR